MNENEPAKNSESTKNDGNLRNIRTYESDVADVLAKRNTSSVTIALAESRKNQGNESFGDIEEQSQTKKKILIVIISILLAGGGIFGAYYLYSISPLAPAPTISNTPQGTNSLIPIDSQSVIEVSATSNPADIKNSIKNEFARNQAPQTIRELALVTSVAITSGDDAGKKKLVRIPTQTMISSLGINMPDLLYRSLESNWMLGIYADADGQKSIFVILTNNFFQNTFAGMLQWENIMADDLKEYLVTSGVNGIANAPTIASSTASTTPEADQKEQYVPKYTTIRGQFVDKIIKNKDLREFISGDGELVFLYSFLDNKRLIFTSREDLVTEIMSRLEKQAFVR